MQRYLTSFLIILLCFSLQSCHPKSKNQLASQVPTDPAINANVGKLFLARNKLKPGVHTLPTGLQFMIIKDGIGMHPTPKDLVSVTYQGQYIDGQIFDNQHAINPVKVRISSVIPGWQEALQLMLPGSVWALYIPPNLAYGERGIPGLVGPEQTLVYYVALVGINS